MMKNRLKNLGNRASDSDADILRDEFADFGKDAQIPDDAKERILSSVMGKAGFKMNGTNGVIKGQKNITANKTDNNITEQQGKLRIHRGGAIAACIAVLAAGAVTTSIFFKNNNIKHSGITASKTESSAGTITLPDFVGKNINDVEKTFGDKLHLTTIPEYNPDYEPGIIYWQSDAPGEELSENDTLILKFSVQTAEMVDVVGSDEDVAASEIRAAGFNPVVIKEYSEEIAEGIAIRTDPPAGTQVGLSSDVKLYIATSDKNAVTPEDDSSKGFKEAGYGELNMPNFVGKEIKQIQEDYSGKLDIKILNEYNVEYEEGIIFSQSVEPKDVIKEGSTVTLKVSKGKQMAKIPDVTGSDSVVAESELRAAGFTVVLRSKYDDNVPEGVVVATEPAAGSELEYDGTVTLFISKGALDDLVKVPNVVGLNKESAIKLLKENDLKPVVIDLPHDGDKGKVIDQSINPGWKIDKDTEVNIYVSTGESDPVDLSISIPMPDGLSGEFTLDGYVNGNRRYTQSISNGEAVSGGATTLDITGKNKETITVMIKNENTGKSVTYAEFFVNYDKKTAELNGSLNKDGLLATMK